MNVVEMIQNNYSSLTKKQKSIADFLLANSVDICYMTLKEASRRADASELTILRLCTAVGFPNFIELKNAFRAYHQNLVDQYREGAKISPPPSALSAVGKQQALLNVAQTEQDTFAQFCNRADGEAFLQTARDILTSRYLLLYGHDFSKLLVDYLRSRFSQLNLYSIVTSPDDYASIQFQLSQLTPADMVFLVSFPNYYHMIPTIAKCAREKGALVVGLTDSPESPLVPYCSQVYYAPVRTLLDFNSMTTPLMACNLLVSALTLEIAEEFPRPVRSGMPQPIRDWPGTPH